MIFQNSLFVFVILSFALLSCNSVEKKENATDKSLTEQTAVPPEAIPLPLDSAFILRELNQHGIEGKVTAEILQFYERRKFLSAWLTLAGLNEDASKLMNLLDNDISRKKDEEFNERLSSLYNAVTDNHGDTASFHNLEVMLTASFFLYGQRNWSGKEDLQSMAGWFIERKKLNLSDVLDSILKGKDQSVFWYEPMPRQYRLLKNYIVKYSAMPREWIDSIADSPVLPGDTTGRLIYLKKALYFLNDMEEMNSLEVYDSRLQEALTRFQYRHGIDTSGVLDEATLKWLQKYPDEIVKQLLVNVERFKWMPLNPEGRHIKVNIPGFSLLLYNNDSIFWQTRIIAGATATKTVLFNGSIHEIIFRPSWTMPRSIFINEALPSLRRDESYLSRNNMVVLNRDGSAVTGTGINWNLPASELPYILRQRPGPSNSLGLIKFNINNPYGIYLHDTPSKSLFEKKQRAFSHGCIRVQHADILAGFLLNQPEWAEEKIRESMNGPQTVTVPLKEKIPVIITYFTAWTDRHGKLYLRNDIYGHDERMRKMLFN